jgi:hypothetical protein
MYEYLGVLIIKHYNELDISLKKSPLLATLSVTYDVGYICLISTFLLSVILVYFIYMRNFNKYNTISNSDYVMLPQRTFLFIVLLFGVVSVISKAGQSSLNDYSGVAVFTTPFFYYGIILLPAPVLSLYLSFSKKKYIMAAIIFLMILPLCHEIFISSRRQYFAPSIFAILLYYLYSGKKTWLSIKGSLLVVFFVLLFAYQYAMRYQFVGDYAVTNPYELVLGPQLGEFLAIGETTYQAWRCINFTEMFAPTIGGHWGYQLLNAVPFVKFGSYLFSDYNIFLSRIFSVISPWGGISIVADTLIAFGNVGVLIVPIFLGCLLGYCQVNLTRAFYHDSFISTHIVFTIVIGTAVLLKHRSGFVDMLQAIVYFYLLIYVITTIERFFSTQAKR